MSAKGSEGDEVLNWTSSGVIGERVRVMSIDAFSSFGGGGETLRGVDVGGFNGMMLIFGLLEDLEMEALVDAMDVDNG
ncbi:hypothetical protein Tco_1449670 [Tanacetum coccineum]